MSECNRNRHEFAGWGRTRRATSYFSEPATENELVREIQSEKADTLLAFGKGRSYGDAAINSSGRLIWTRRLKKIHSFDSSTGAVVCDAGVTIADLLDRFFEKGFVPTVCPGTSFVTIGGAIANDVHGKNHDRDGSFGDHVDWIDLVTAGGNVLRLSEKDNHDLFEATIGGIGLTGIIVKASIRLSKIPANSVRLKEIRCPNLESFIENLLIHRETAKYSVGWVDALATGASLGRGILEVGELSHQPVDTPARRIFTVPFNLPGWALNKYSVRTFNEIYYRRVPVKGRERLIDFGRFTFPLDAMYEWNRIYGSSGFYQFQCVLPETDALAGLRALLKIVSASGQSSFLAILKTMGSSGHGHLSFPMKGFTLALDIPQKKGTDELLARLEEQTLLHNGRIYLAKDAAMSCAGFHKMYPGIDQFETILKKVDPHHRFRSDMADRLGIRAE